ncbi:bestrophin family ion channel [Stenotrophomonas sp. NLF4-10]|uniref:bestrophin family protein n=1 Tax=Stenotrophomonas sp. NLF4-10 TaxID=2918754 RepID=UPI001EFBDC96|nr:bestrophin family ion channel [Stenotrophomonas sp. NLF4-10]MCG8275283.1 bestrophin [Stenotrophomonas sp. NLF4-10]
MIIQPRPRGWQLLYIRRGSIVPAIAPRVLAIGGLAVGATLLAKVWHPFAAGGLAVAPFTLLGLVLSIFLSFRNNACHERWWEGRKLWGQLLIEARGFARLANALLPADAALRRRVSRPLVGFSHALAAQLRGREEIAAAMPWLEPDQLAAFERRNVPDGLLALVAAELAASLRAGRIDSYLYGRFEAHLHALASVQGACERIAGTPLPFAYTLLLHRCVWLFCVLLPFGLAGALGWATPVVSMLLAYAFFGLDQVGEELEEPFGLEANDLPLDAMVRTIEIDVLDALGERPLPEPLQPQGYLLQ